MAIYLVGVWMVYTLALRTTQATTVLMDSKVSLPPEFSLEDASLELNVFVTSAELNYTRGEGTYEYESTRQLTNENDPPKHD